MWYTEEEVVDEYEWDDVIWSLIEIWNINWSILGVDIEMRSIVELLV